MMCEIKNVYLLFLLVAGKLSALNLYRLGRDTPDLDCQCVRSHLCADNDESVNGVGKLDIRMDYDECPNHLDVCCDNVIPEVKPVETVFKGCGFENTLGFGTRITADSKTAQFGEVPWTALIFVRDVNNTDRNMYKCGASVIHPQVVVTAAHCVTNVDVSHITIRAGEWNTTNQDEPLPHQDRTATEISFYPRYNQGSLRNDIAIVFLSEPLTLAKNVGVICLPSRDFKINPSQCLASGWGKDSFKKGRHSSILRKVDLPIVAKRDCTKLLRNTRLGPLYNLHRSFLCAGGKKNKDTCKGDGGSPLVCPLVGQRGRYVQMGIVSWGIGCGDETPGVYVNVALFTEWIKKQVISKNMDSKYFLTSAT